MRTNLILGLTVGMKTVVQADNGLFAANFQGQFSCKKTKNNPLTYSPESCSIGAQQPEY
jgi:hypothetical protein